jgi:hypothetical protein
LRAGCGDHDQIGWDQRDIGERRPGYDASGIDTDGALEVKATGSHREQIEGHAAGRKHLAVALRACRVGHQRAAIQDRDLK